MPTPGEPPTRTPDTGGIVQLDNLLPGTYWITVRRIGYVSLRQRVEVSARTLRVVRVGLRPTICTLGSTERKSDDD